MSYYSGSGEGWVDRRETVVYICFELPVLPCVLLVLFPFGLIHAVHISKKSLIKLFGLKKNSMNIENVT